MKITISAVLRGQIVVEVQDDENLRTKIEDFEPPFDLEDFELHSGITVDADEFLNSGHIEIEACLSGLQPQVSREENYV